MIELIEKIKSLQESDIKETVDQRIQEFKQVQDVFSELCFCLMTANFSASGGIRIQKEIGSAGFCELPEQDLAGKLKSSGHRFPNARANYICGARDVDLDWALKNLQSNELREWLVEKVKGLGMKEASHFLRNIGYDDFAIIDFHIVDLLVKQRLIEKPNNLNPKKYVEIEKLLRDMALKSNLTLAELDLYLWYMETGKILK
jgi:N-glycosylase/DNA lyase